MYIVFEGMVGSWKSTQSKKLFAYMHEKYPDRKVIHVREPGSTLIAQEIRLLAQAREFEEEMDPICEAYLYAAARAQLLHTVVRQTLDVGGVVISDRNFISSLAYQGEARGLGFDRVLHINHHAIDGVMPDYVLHMQIDVDQALARTFDTAGDKFEKMGPDFFHLVNEWYRKASELPMLRDGWRNVDAHGGLDTVFERILGALGEK